VEPERCAQCGFDGAVLSAAEVLAQLRTLGHHWSTLVAGVDDDTLHRRPAPGVWSAAEYAKHSADVTALHRYAADQVVTVDRPEFPVIGDDVVQRTIDEAPPIDLAAELARLSEESVALAAIGETAGEGAWSRTATIGDNEIDLRFLLEHCLHDAVHHLDDVERGLRELRAG
jgi:hypothetical protein